MTSRASTPRRLLGGAERKVHREFRTSREPYVPRRPGGRTRSIDPLFNLGRARRQVGVGLVGLGLEVLGVHAVSYTHLTLPTILLV